MDYKHKTALRSRLNSIQEFFGKVGISDYTPLMERYYSSYSDQKKKDRLRKVMNGRISFRSLEDADIITDLENVMEEIEKSLKS